MLNLHFAPSANLLIPVLLEKIRPVWTDPFHPPTLIVPSPAVGKWLTLRLADHSGSPGPGFGCVANLEMLTLERFLWKALTPAENMQRLDAAVLQQVICALINSSLLEENSYITVRAYLMKQDGTIDPVKKVQLASKIARRFQEYEFNRPSVWDEKSHTWRRSGMDAHWLSDKTYFNDAENEPWQKDLYCRAKKCIGMADSSDNAQYISLPHLYRLRRENSLESGGTWAKAEGSILIFGVSKVSHFHRNTLVEISRMPRVDMHVFLTNPCAEFWEDVDTWRSHRYPRKWEHDSPVEKAGVAARNPDDYNKGELKDFAHLPEDPKLLELWGLSGKENIYLWCPPSEWNFEYYCPDDAQQDEPPETLLKALQKALLRREKNLPAPAQGEAWKDRNDGSLQVLACPDQAREVEELREQILDLVKEKKITRLNEITVYLPDPGAYLVQILRVFGAYRQSDPGYIPFLVLGAPGSDSLFGQGMHTLLEIIEGRFDRARVFALLANPIVQSTRDISPDAVTIWEDWAEELGIFRGFNKEHREQMGDKGQTITDVHTFELGIARLLIGNLAAGPVDLAYRLQNDDPGKAFSAIPPFRDYDTQDANSVEQFCGLAEDLYNDVRQLTGSTAGASLSENVNTMTDLVWKWFGTIPQEAGGNMAAEGRVRNDFLDAIRNIKLQKDLAGRETCAGTEEFIALVKECLPGELPAGSRAWTGGITFAPLRPAMVVPHNVIFALGLGATAFPGTNENPTWDLLSRTRIVGDSDRVRDNRFAFLELLHAAQERLVLSFRSRNMQKEEDLQPSSVILELESYLKEQGLAVYDEEKKEERCTVRQNIPWIVHESFDEIKINGRKHGSWDPSEVRLAGLDGCSKVTSRYGAADVQTRGNKQGPLHTSIRNLRLFFSNPLEYHLSKTLGIELDEQPSTMGATDEPLQSGNLEMSCLQKAVWTELLCRVFPENEKNACVDPGSLAEAATTIAMEKYREYLLQGKSPEAQFYTMEEQYLAAWAQRCVEPTLMVYKSFKDHKLVQGKDLALCRPDMRGEYAVDMGKDGSASIECRHELALVPRSGTGGIGIIIVKKDGLAKENPGLWLTGVIQWLADRKNNSPQDITLIQLVRGDLAAKPGASFSRMKKQCEGGNDPEQWLCGLIHTMLIERSCDNLPFAIVRELCETGDDGRLDLNKLTRDNIEELLLRERSPYRCWLEAYALIDARIPDVGDKELQKRAQDRFAPMLEGWVHE
jgi:exonuclease V gamma subunit